MDSLFALFLIACGAVVALCIVLGFVALVLWLGSGALLAIVRLFNTAVPRA